MSAAYDYDAPPVWETIATRPRPPTVPTQAAAEGSPPDLSARVISLAPVDKTELPQRDWLIDGVFMRRNVTLLVGRGGAGKSLLALQLAIAVASNRRFGEWQPRYPTRALVLNVEDDLHELQRRMLSACEAMGVSQSEIQGRLLTISDLKSLVMCTRDPKDDKIKTSQLYRALRDYVTANEIGLLVLDPLVEAHAYLDENSNTDMRELITALRDLARDTSIALAIVHHTRKGSANGDQDAARGGSAIVNACRVVLTVEPATLPDTVQDREKYIQVSSAKSNYAARGGRQLFKLRSVALRNGGAVGDDPGDISPGLEPASIDSLADVLPKDIRSWPHLPLLLEAVSTGIKGYPYSASTTSGANRLSLFVMDRFNVGADVAKLVLERCVEAKLIKVAPAKSASRNVYNAYFLADEPHQEALPIDDEPPF